MSFFKVYVTRLISQSGELLLNHDLIVRDGIICIFLNGVEDKRQSYPITMSRTGLPEEDALPLYEEQIDNYVNHTASYIDKFNYRSDFPEPGGSGRNELFFDDFVSLQRNYLLAPLTDQIHKNERIYDRLPKSARMFFKLPPDAELFDNTTLFAEFDEWREYKQAKKDKLSAFYEKNPLFGRF